MLSETKTNENMQIFKERLKALRGKRSLQEVAHDLGISRATLGYYENGDRKPDIEVLLKIASYYNVSCDYLLGLTDCLTLDIDNRAISEKTGLSEEAVESLCFCNDIAHTETDSKYVHYFMHTVNLLLFPECRLVDQISEYLNFNFDFAIEVRHNESEHDYEISPNTIPLDALAICDRNGAMSIQVDSELINKALLVNIQNELVQMRSQILESKLSNCGLDKE